MLSAGEKGRIGEFIAAASIESLGWKTSFAQMEAIDLLAFKNNCFLRVQVKAARTNSDRGRYGFMVHNHARSQLDQSKVDIFAFVALDVRKTIFVSARNLITYKKYFKKDDYIPANLESDSWIASINTLSNA